MAGQVAHSLRTGSDHGDASPAYSSAFSPLLSVAVTQTAGSSECGQWQLSQMRLQIFLAFCEQSRSMSLVTVYCWKVEEAKAH